jgi:hypothetical protein
MNAALGWRKLCLARPCGLYKQQRSATSLSQSENDVTPFSLPLSRARPTGPQRKAMLREI